MPPCTALYLSDGRPCELDATSVNGLFCSFHSKQCQGLYRGYKIRNSRLDELSAAPPPYLAKAAAPLANQTFGDVDQENVLHQVHDHLFLRFQLLDRVIRARKFHHSRFFSLNLDYGHQHFLDNLQNQKFIVLRALERLERRTAEVLYKKQKWFKWVRECQDEEEAQRENEKKKVKAEAALFRSHWKQVQKRMKKLREREDKKRQEEYLEEVYQERLREDEEATWDPIEDVIANERGSYVDLIKHFLWLEELKEDSTAAAPNPGIHSAVEATTSEKENVPPQGIVKSSKKSRKKAQDGEPKQDPPTKGKSETRADMHYRLKNGSQFNYDFEGLMIRGTIESPVETMEKTASIPDQEIQKLLEEVSEIKNILFCRLLLSHATLLPAALRTSSVLEFLDDEEVTDSDLRDLCLKMENPDLQTVRDACADLFRGELGEEEDGEEEQESEEGEDDINVSKKMDALNIRPRQRPGAIPDKWSSQRERIMEETPKKVKGDEQGNLVDFGDIDDNGNYQPKNIRVRVCGRTIWNYPSNKAMNRGGWLCRHWDEFFELNILAIWQYFPAANWLGWVGNRFRQQLLQLGLILYSESSDPDACMLTVRHQTGSRGAMRRQHRVFEARNYMCFHIKRNDLTSRRFIQYLTMQTSRVLLLVRDAKNGSIIIKPPEEERWLWRQKSGIGRAVKNEWQVLKQVGPEFFEAVDRQRNWHFGFRDHYDVYVWDLEPGEQFPSLYNLVQQMLIKAHRFCSGADFYNPAAPILRTLTRDPVSHRVREIQSGEEVESIYDFIHHEGTKFMFGEIGKDIKPGMAPEEVPPPLNMFYNEADALEDQILFPEETSQNPFKALVQRPIDRLRALEEGPPDMAKFVHGWDSDEEDELAMGLEYDEGVSEDEASVDDSDEEGRTMINDFGPDSVDEMFGGREMTTKEPTMEEQFAEFMEKEMAQAFKKVWHEADLEPGAQVKYREAKALVRAIDIFDRPASKSRAVTCFQLMDLLDIWQNGSGSAMKDLRRAVCSMALFFPTTFFDSDAGKTYKDSLLINQGERAKQIPDRRRHDSNKYMPSQFWDEWKTIKQGMRSVEEDYPRDWDVAIRPIIARLYKTGVIRPAHYPVTPGLAIAAKEPGRNVDLYIDLRVMIKEIQMPAMLQDPKAVEPFLSRARRFAKANSNARFAVLRMWSSPYFYPLMVGPDNDEISAFTDSIGRNFVWKFVPKDMPFSEWSMHQTARQRLLPYSQLLAEKVSAKRNGFLVMGKDQDDLFKLASATTFAIQTRPWRWEVDLWKSFINVDLAFLEQLHNDWLE